MLSSLGSADKSASSKVSSFCKRQVATAAKPALLSPARPVRARKARLRCTLCLCSRVSVQQALTRQARPGHVRPRKLRNPAYYVDWDIYDQDEQLIGTIKEILQPQAAGSCPVLRVQALISAASSSNSDGTSTIEQHLIPWMQSIVQRADHATRCLFIIPTPGLLELGRQQGLLQRLKPELEALGTPPSDSLARRLGQRYMPTKQQLMTAGRQDLVKLVLAAGGFITVAQLLGLRARRRPEGYWRESENLDRELSLFVAGMWTCLTDSADEPYYYNQVTGKSQFEEPQSPVSVPLDDAGTVLFVDDDTDRVMPSRSVVQAAGRYDLHHAIMYQGGYREAAQTLDRPHTWPRHQRCETAQQLAEELQDFNREQELPVEVIPSANILRLADRHDLLTDVQRFGGALTLAPQVGMKTQRGSGFQSVSNAAQQLLLFVQQLNKGSQARHAWHMPTQQQLRKAGRHDLLHAMSKFGQASLAEAAQLKQNRRGNPRRKSHVQGVNLAV